jgi:hypothetical protein
MIHYGLFLSALHIKLHILDPFKEVVKVILSDRENVNGLIKKKMFQTSFKRLNNQDDNENMIKGKQRIKKKPSVSTSDKYFLQLIQ